MNGQRILSLVVLVSVLFGAGGCPTESRKALIQPALLATDDPEAEAAFRRGVELFDAARYEAADAEFADFERRFPDDVLIPQSTIFRARIAIAQKKYEEARARLEPLSEQVDGPEIHHRARLYMGVAYYHLGQWRRAIEYLRRYVGSLADPLENRLVLETLWRSAIAEGETEDLIVWLELYLEASLEDSKKREARKILEQSVSSLDERDTLEVLRDRLSPEGFAWPLVMGRLAWYLYEQQEFESAEQVVSAIQKADAPIIPSVESLIALLEKRNAVDLTTIGCLLPLSGRSRLAGEETLRGVMIGAREFRFGDAMKPLSVVIKDTGGDPAKAAEMVRTLVEKDLVAAIAGPMDGKVSRAAAAQAEALGVPMILLASGDDMTGLGRYSFRHFALNEAEIRALVDMSVSQADARFGVLYPESSYGNFMKKRFEEELSARGKTLAGAVSFPVGTRDFSDYGVQVAKLEMDALLLPMSASELALAAPALAAAGVWSRAEGAVLPAGTRTLRFLVPSVGYTGDVVRRAGRYLQGAWFASQYNEQSSSAAMGFGQKYAADFGKPPSHFAAYGRDAVVLLAMGLESGAQNRPALRSWIAGAGGNAGLRSQMATQFQGFDASGETLAVPQVYALRGEQLELCR